MTYNFWQGKNIRLRAPEMKDGGTFFKLGADYDDELDRCTDEIHFPSSPEGAMKRHEYRCTNNSDNDEYLWVIEDKDGQAVGCINTFNCNRRVGSFQYGLGIAREHWRKGYASEAILLVLKYFFMELRYQKVTVGIYSFNDKSIKLHEKLGFTCEGRLRRTVFTGGEYYDEIMYGMTCEEFKVIEAERNKLKLTYHIVTEEEKAEICSWRYEGKYSMYDLPEYEEFKAKKKGFCNPDHEKNYYSFYNEDKLIGFVNIFEEEKEIFIGIGVTPDSCGQGYGKAMLDTAYKISKELYPEKPLYLEVRTWNKRAVNCYKSAGFVIDKTVEETTSIGPGEFYRMVRE